MQNESEEKSGLKSGKVKLRKEITSLRKALHDYKAERKSSWKSFKQKMNDDIKRLKKLSKIY